MRICATATAPADAQKCPKSSFAMKIYFLFVSCIFFIILQSNGQTLGIDEGEGYDESIYMRQLVEASDILIHDKVYTNENSTIYDNVYSNFCSLAKYEKQRADSLISILLNSSGISDLYIYQFSISSYECLSEKQKTVIVAKIRSSILPTSPYFNTVISLFNLQEWKDYLVNSLKTPDLYTALTIDLGNSVIKKNHIQELKNMASLANFGDILKEKELMELVSKCYDFAKGHRDSVRLINAFYWQLLPASLGELFSKQAIFDTIHFLDEGNVVASGGDAIDFGFCWQYYINCVAPKIKRNKRILLLGDENIPQIKEILLNDPDIWLPHIR